MGLDVTLGVIILVAAFRGWFQGFVSQAVRIAGLVACVYLAEPVRDYAKPYVLPYLPAIQPGLVDRMLWWVSAVVTYVVSGWCRDLDHQHDAQARDPGHAQAGRNDQFAGFMLGASKGLLVAAFATAGIQKYGMEPIKSFPWAEEQVKTSWAAKWNEDYHPVPRIWSSPPVRHFVNYVDRMGLRKPAGRRRHRTVPRLTVPARPFAPPAARPIRMSPTTLNTQVSRKNPRNWNGLTPPTRPSPTSRLSSRNRPRGRTEPERWNHLIERNGFLTPSRPARAFPRFKT